MVEELRHRALEVADLLGEDRVLALQRRAVERSLTLRQRRHERLEAGGVGEAELGGAELTKAVQRRPEPRLK